jgi:PleD family two-component response regulator
MKNLPHRRPGVRGVASALPGTTEVRRVTISAGVASALLASAADAHALLRDADIALYQAKREDRDRVCLADARAS